MESFAQEHVVGIPLASFAYANEKTQGKPSCSALIHKKNKKSSFIQRMSKLSHKTDSYVQGFKEHLTLGPKIAETFKGKLSFAAKLLQAGSIDKVFREYFAVEKDEKLLKAFQCYLSTTAGPIAGMLFISTEKIAFHSDRTLNLACPKGGSTRVPYKVLIPAKRIKSVAVRKNLYNPDEKYIDVVTVDGFDFWFMGFISYKKSFKYLQHVISELR
ncbi:putative GEM-like protein 8 [Phragmites australis]|uniref:putative GEM-like protein 8 n=1 Tax=Phragmites australis TaxID=29695 RepID=UPI002D78A04C|nr:putative GEM-like protein 8 [Phragmites australis]